MILSTKKLLAVCMTIASLSVAKAANAADESGSDLERHEGSGWLGNCQGDCDYDSDCRGSLICYQRNAGDPVPCCPHIGTGGRTDFCAPRGCNTPRPTPRPTPNPTNAPVEAPGSTDVDVGIIVCFSGDTTVEVLNKGEVPMMDLQVGDHALTYNKKESRKEYAPIYAFGHYQKDQEATFLVLETTMANSTTPSTPLEISGDHMIYLMGKETPVRAASIQFGDRIAPSGAVVTGIRSVTKTGIYAPLTTTGNLLVNGNLLASSYATVVQKTNDHLRFANGTPFLSHHDGIHVVLTPFRIWCRAALALGGKCDIPDDNSTGMPAYVSYGIEVLEWVDRQSSLLQTILLIFLALPVFFPMFLLERVVLERPLAIGLGILCFAATVALKSGVKGSSVGARQVSKNKKI